MATTVIMRYATKQDLIYVLNRRMLEHGNYIVDISTEAGLTVTYYDADAEKNIVMVVG